MLILCIEQGDTLTRLNLGQKRLTLGRSAECDIVLDSQKVSREHAEISVDNDLVVIRDLRSQNGIYCDAQRLTQATPMILGQSFRLGDFMVHLAEHEGWSMHLQLNNEEHHFALPVGKYVLGRSSACDITLSDDSISRNHLELNVQPKHVLLNDLQSQNGTFVGGRGFTETTVSKTCKISIGDYQGTLENTQKKSKRPPITLKPIYTRAFVLAFALGTAIVLLLPKITKQSNAQEENYRRQVDILSRQTKADIQNGNLEAAAITLRALLEHDSANVWGQARFEEIEFELKSRRATQEAMRAVNLNEAQRAYQLLRPYVLADTVAPEVLEVWQRARTALGRKITKDAQKFCLEQKYRACHQKAQRAQELSPQLPLPAALSLLAEFELFTAGQSLATTQLPTLEKLASAKRQALTQGRLYYAAGLLKDAGSFFSKDQSGDAKRARTALGELKSNLNRLRTAARASPEQQENWAKKVLRYDTEILGGKVRSVIRHEAQRALAQSLVERGRLAEGRADYMLSYTFYTQAIRNGAEDPSAHQALEDLELRALEAIPGYSKNGACTELKAITRYTRAQSKASVAAQSALSRCKSK